MMNAKYLEEAGQIVAGVKWCDKMLSQATIEPKRIRLNMPSMQIGIKQGFGLQENVETINLNADIQRVAFRLWLESVKARRDKYTRRASQIGLVLENRP